MAVFHEMELVAGVTQASAQTRVVDLRDANAAGVAFENLFRSRENRTIRGGPRCKVRCGVLLF